MVDLPHEMVIAILSHLSPPQILALRLPAVHMKDVLYTQANCENRKKVCKLAIECSRANFNFFYHRQFFNMIFIATHKLKSYELRTTFDTRYVVKRDLVLYFLDKCCYITRKLSEARAKTVTAQQLSREYAAPLDAYAPHDMEFVCCERVLALDANHSYGKNARLDAQLLGVIGTLARTDACACSKKSDDGVLCLACFRQNFLPNIEHDALLDYRQYCECKQCFD
ncbi:hypothetical protein QKQ66_gp152 [Dione juno nucleopolyhedrovirus]|uniref:F-box domain-containing protein n=1 Tax=Dione juno nucleopolyhedrovirus TaxID=2594175 RepID=A0AAE6H3I5_9ABAC|nr:hypothetical protein QKQ66_gp152 [Dione juno nucleopolyhedrovirus]QDL57081.1 hypothetical protein DijuNPV-ORF-152 [Dione juno nucleopolyhedrovirus]